MVAYCSMRFLLLLRSHSRKHQALEFKFTCEHCDYKTKLSGHLKRHMRVHEMEQGKIYKCPHCDYACNNSVSIHEARSLIEILTFVVARRKICGNTSWRPTSIRESSSTSASTVMDTRRGSRATRWRNINRTCSSRTAPRRRIEAAPTKPRRCKSASRDEVNCKEINSNSTGTWKRARKSCRNLLKPLRNQFTGDLMRFNNFDC